MLVALTRDRTAPLALIRLWAFCQQRRSESFEVSSGEYFRAICRWKSDGVKLLAIMEQCGFVHVEGKQVTVHQWAEYNSGLIASWRNGAKGGRPTKGSNPEKTHGLPVGIPAAPQRTPTVNPEGTDKRREDQTGKEESLTKGAGAPGVELPTSLNTSGFRSAWEDFRKHRQEIGKPMKPTGETALIGTLATYGPDEAITRIRQAIANGWQGVVFNQRGKTNGKSRPTTDEDHRNGF